jgi:hypothetical protein
MPKPSVDTCADDAIGTLLEAVDQVYSLILASILQLVSSIQTFMQNAELTHGP